MRNDSHAKNHISDQIMGQTEDQILDQTND